MRLLVALAFLVVHPGVGAEEVARPLASLPYTPGLDPESMDRSVDPCTDFYAYSCKGWMARNPIPPDQSTWHVYSKMEVENRQLLWGILQRAADFSGPRSPSERRAGDYFAACMDEQAVEAAGAGPLRRELAGIDALRSKWGIAALLGRVHRSLGSEVLFGIGSEQDARDARQVIAVLGAGGLGLPDRDYYLSDEPRMQEARDRYRAYLARLLELAGDRPEAAAAAAERVLAFETALARATLDRVSRREPHNLYHRVTPSQLAVLTPAFEWVAYLRAVGAPPLRRLDLSEPAFFLAVQSLLEEEPLQGWKEYLRARLADARAPYLSRAFQRASFEFHAAYLNGVREEQPRWKKCVGWVDRDLGEALGRMFVARAFPPEVKRQALDVTLRIELAMGERLKESAWMTEPTRRAALGKLAAVRQNIGYPDRWRSYRGLAVSRTDFAGNVVAASGFETARQLAKIGRPVDRGEWSMTAPTVNAYYDPQRNDINFPAGVLLPPLWDPLMDLAPGYGNTGLTVGHELTHAFDDEGRQFDAYGNLRNWWTPQDADAFRARAACIVDQYGRYPVIDDLKINSRLTVGEDIADLGGGILAWMAWKDATRGQALEPRDELTPDQRFFVGLAQGFCESDTEESMRLLAKTDPHSPSRWRVNGVVSNMPEFRQAFSCPAGSALAPEKTCQVW
jgi:endothelin-converting enzyme/putative endopeptidase